MSSTEPLPSSLQTAENAEEFELRAKHKYPSFSAQDLTSTYLRTNELDFLIVPSATAAKALDTLETAYFSIIFDATEPYVVGKNNRRKFFKYPTKSN